MFTRSNRQMRLIAAAALSIAASAMTANVAYARGWGIHGGGSHFGFGAPLHGPGSSHNPIVVHPVRRRGPIHPPIAYPVAKAPDRNKSRMTYCDLREAGLQVRNHRGLFGAAGQITDHRRYGGFQGRCAGLR
jgi:hypothetical protein